LFSCRHAVQTNSYTRSTTQTLSKTSQDRSGPTSTQTSVGSSTRTSLVPPNSASNTRTRPPVTRPIQAYRGSQTSFHSNTRLSNTPSSVERPVKKINDDFNRKISSTSNSLLHDVSNKPLNAPVRAQIGPQRRSMAPTVNSNSSTMNANADDGLPNTSSSISSVNQGRKSGIPTVDKPQRTSTSTLTR
jgi:hypothetical protein